MDKLLDLYFEIKDSKPEHRKSLLNLWKSYTDCEYPRVKNHKGKEIDFIQYCNKNSKKEQTKKQTDSLDDLINKKSEESKLISNTLYSHAVTDISDPFRKRRKP